MEEGEKREQWHGSKDEGRAYGKHTFSFWGDLEQIYTYLILNCVSVIFYLMIMDLFMNFSAGL